jgi:mannose-6-phosphate isomerase-like protein (cupin superfamily)
MRSKTLRFDSEFRTVFTVRDVQAAEMTLAAGNSTGGPDNTHRGADQWFFVVDGCGEALIGHDENNRERVTLEPDTLLVIERGEAHEIRNTGDAPLKTLNFYYPPAFDADGEPVGAGKAVADDA